MPIIAMNNVGAKLLGADERAIAIVSDALSYDDESAKRRSGIFGQLNSKRTFLRYPELICEAGFVPVIQQALAEAGYAVSIHDQRTALDCNGPAIDLHSPTGWEVCDDGKQYPVYGGYLDGIGLRDYQANVVETFVLEKRGIIQAATGAGKTEIACAITKRVGRPTLFLTHKLDLVGQTRLRFKKRLGVNAGMISEGEWLPGEITVATVQTIMAHWTRIWSARLRVRIVDQTLLGPIKALKNAKRKTDELKAAAMRAEAEIKRRGHFYVVDPATASSKKPRPLTEVVEKRVRGLTQEMALQAAREIEHAEEVLSVTLVDEPINRVAEFLRSIELLIVDEAHRSSGNGFFTIISNCPNAYFRASLTATPLMKGKREDDLRLIATSGRIICRITNGELIRRGILATPYFRFNEVPAFGFNEREVRREIVKSGKKVQASAIFQAAYRMGIVENDVRNRMVVEDTQELVDEGRKTVVLFQQQEHGKRIYDMLLAAGMRCRLLYGEDDIDVREDVKRALREGEIDVMVASTILDEGIDEPCISGIVLAGGGKSKISLFQRVGRSVRKKTGEELEKLGNTARIIDYIDTGSQHLKKHSALRFKAVREEDGWIVEAIRMYADRYRRAA